MTLGHLAQAVGLFVGTNIDDIVLLALLFGWAEDRAAERRVVLGQFLGFGALLLLSVLGALGAGLLPERLLPLLGLLPLGMGIRLGWKAWREHRAAEEVDPVFHAPGADAGEVTETRGLSVLAVTSMTVANGGDNVGVYVPAFAASGTSALLVYVPVFLGLTWVWCVAGRYTAGHPAVAKAIERRGHVLLPVVLVAIGLVVLLS